MADTDRLAKEIAGILRSSGSRQTKAYDTPAVVRRVDGSTAWVHIPGGVDETPVQLTVAASAGDTVQVRVSGGTAWIVGNASAPPTDDKAARAAQDTADEAAQVAEAAEMLGAEARQTARAAAKIAGDTEQHFWFTETGTDTGAHITEKTQEDFLADPDNGGGNLLARSNGIAVRDGLVELAQFSADGIELNNSQMNVFRAKTSGTTSTTRIYDTVYNGAISSGEEISLTRVCGTLTGSIDFNLVNFSPPSQDSANFTAGTAGSDTLTVSGASARITYDGASTFNITITASSNIQQLQATLNRFETIDAPYFTLGTRAGDTGGFSTTIGEGLYAENPHQVSIGAYNNQDQTARVIFSAGDGINDTYRKDIYQLRKDGSVNIERTISIRNALSALGWSNVEVTDAGSSSLIYLQALLEKLLSAETYWEKVWDGGLYLDNRHTVTWTGTNWKTMRLVWSGYANGTTQDYDWQIFEVPRHFATDHSGNGVNMVLGQGIFNFIGSKYVYVFSDHITGNANNNTSGTNATTGIKYNNSHWVLRELWLERTV